jgi:hypothetical protein
MDASLCIDISSPESNMTIRTNPRKPLVVCVSTAVLMAIVGASSLVPSIARAVGMSEKVQTSLIEMTVRRTPEQPVKGIMTMNGGIELTALARIAEGSLLGIDEESCEIATWKDDKGTDYSATEGFGKVPWLGSFPQMSDDGSAMKFELVTRIEPVAGATTMTLDATVGLLVGSEPKTETLKAVQLVKGTTLNIGGIEATISDISEGFGDGKQITLEAKRDFKTLKSFTVLDDKGQPVETSRAGSGSFGWGNDYTYQVSYSVAGELPASADIQVESYSKIETVPVRIAQTIGFGM